MGSDISKCSKVLGFMAKGSFGPILKVKDKFKENTSAVKRQLKHPFVLNLQDCCQTQRHLFMMCDYYSTGDLYTYRLLKGQFGEDEVRVFAAELGSALGRLARALVSAKGDPNKQFLHDFGIMHRDVKMENVILSDQVHSELDHCNMLKKVRDFPYSMPTTFSPPLTLLLTELLCKNPANRLRNLERLERQAFFSCTSFDSKMLQKTPVIVILELRNHPDRAAKAMRGFSVDNFHNFDCDKIINSPTTPTDLSSTLTDIDVNQATEQAQA